MVSFTAEALRKTAVSHDAERRHDPDLVEQSTLPVRTCGRRSFPDRPWHVSRVRPAIEGRSGDRERSAETAEPGGRSRGCPSETVEWTSRTGRES